MKLSIEQYHSWTNRSITLLGMSGVGKTHLSTMLRHHQWFHYSGDYRIGTRYLNEPILDQIKQQAMQIPLLRDMLRRDWIHINNNIKVDDLGPVLSFIGKLGNPEQGGIPLAEFRHRQALYRQGEICAMRDVPEFIRKAKEIYGYRHFVNDVGGSLCELEDESIIKLLAQHTLILYIKVTTAEEEKKLIQRAQSDPKPLYYRPTFLNMQLKKYLAETGLTFAAEINPDNFTRWVFPHLFNSRVPRYEAIAEPFGYTVTSQEVTSVRDEKDFNTLMENAITQHDLAAQLKTH